MKYITTVAMVTMMSVTACSNETSVPRGTHTVMTSEIAIKLSSLVPELTRDAVSDVAAFKNAKTEDTKNEIRNKLCSQYIDASNKSGFDIQAYIDASTFEDMYGLAGKHTSSLGTAKALGEVTAKMGPSILANLGEDCNGLNHVYTTIRGYANKYVTDYAMHYNKYDRTDIATTIKFNEMLKLAK